MHEMSHEELLAKFLGLAPNAPADSEGIAAVQKHLDAAGSLTSHGECQRLIGVMLDFIAHREHELVRKGHAR